MEQTQTLADFITRNAIAMTCEPCDHNPNADGSEWAATASHYRCTLRRGRSRLTVYFSMGSALTHEPSAADVLDSLASDSSGTDSSFEDWCADYGDNPDSIKALRTYRICQRQARKLKQFLGDAQYNALLFNTDRL